MGELEKRPEKDPERLARWAAESSDDRTLQISAGELKALLAWADEPAPPPPNHGILRPQTDWIMVGESRPATEDVMIAWSTDLATRMRIERRCTNGAELATRFRNPGEPMPEPRYDATLHGTEMRNLGEVYAPTYGEAMALMMAKFMPRPPDEPPVQLEPGRRELEPGEREQAEWDEHGDIDYGFPL